MKACKEVIVENNKARIINIQNFSVNDGEGIRSTIFMAGCPLRCEWCANPESWSFENPYVKELSLEEIVREIRRNIIFYRYSGGGITYSGGEPTFQKDLLKKMVDAFYNMGIHQAIETSGYFDFHQLQSVFEKLDFIFVDLKIFDNEKHKEYTSVENKLILENIKKMGRLGIDMVIRIPLIKAINDDRLNIRNTALFVKENVPNGKIEILPYHSLGNHKYDKLGLNEYKNTFDTPRKEEIIKIKDLIQDIGVEITEFK